MVVLLDVFNTLYYFNTYLLILFDFPSSVILAGFLGFSKSFFITYKRVDNPTYPKLNLTQATLTDIPSIV